MGQLEEPEPCAATEVVAVVEIPVQAQVELVGMEVIPVGVQEVAALDRLVQVDWVAPEPVGDAPLSRSSKMKLTQEGIAVVEGDTHLSNWVETFGRLDVVSGLFRALFKVHIKPGMTVCDVGACLGDHSEIYQELVGPTGTVHCFEPNPEAFECLEYNMRKHENVFIHNIALGSHDSTCSIIRNPNLGACQVSDGGQIGVKTLDSVAAEWSRLDFLKIDAEGWEPSILDGSHRTIFKFKPIMLIEVNEACLKPNSSKAELITRIIDLGYCFHVCHPEYSIKDPEFDLLCLPLP